MSKTNYDRVMELEKLRTLDGVKIKELVSLAADVFQYGSAKMLERTLVYVWTKGTKKDAKDYMRVQYDGMLQRVRACGGMCHVDRSDLTTSWAIGNAAFEIGNSWLKRSGLRYWYKYMQNRLYRLYLLVLKHMFKVTKGSVRDITIEHNKVNT